MSNENWFHWPADPRHNFFVTQPFGINAHIYNKFNCGGVPLPGHDGIDFRNRLGDPTVACWDGEVTKVFNFDAGWHNYGHHIKIKHPINGVECETTYCHFRDPLDFSVGDKIKKGQYLGPAGDTGNTNGAHLHITFKRFADNDNGWPCDIVDGTPFFEELNPGGIPPFPDPLPPPEEPDPIPDPPEPIPEPIPDPIPDPPDPVLPPEERRGCLQMMADILMMR